MQCFTLSQCKYIDESDQINADLKIKPYDLFSCYTLSQGKLKHKQNVFFKCLLWPHMQKQDPNADTGAGRFRTKSKL